MPLGKLSFFAYIISRERRVPQPKKLQTNVSQVKRSPHAKIQLFLSTFKMAKKSRGRSSTWPFISPSELYYLALCTHCRPMMREHMKGRVQERPLDFLAFLKVLKNSWILACWLRFTWETLLWNFFGWGALRSQEITYAKNSVFQAASFGDLLLNKRQKKPYYFVEQQTGRLFIVYSTES